MKKIKQNALIVALCFSLPAGPILAVGSSGNTAAAQQQKAPSLATVRVQVQCQGKGSPINVVDVEVSSYKDGAPVLDRQAVKSKVGENCYVDDNLKIVPTDAEKKAAAQAQRNSLIKKGIALVAAGAAALGKTGLSQSLTGLIGVQALMGGSASPEQMALGVKALAGAAIGGESNIQALFAVLKSGPQTVDSYASVIDKQQQQELARATEMAGEITKIKDNPSTDASLSKGKTTESPQMVYANSIKYPTSARAYDGMIEKAAAAYNVDPDILRAMATVESNFNPNARSHVGAIGLVQIMPDTARWLGYTPAQMADPQTNLMAAAKYVAYLKRKSYIGNNLTLISAAYNAGPGNVSKYGGVPPFKETQNHVRKVNAVYYALKARANKS